MKGLSSFARLGLAAGLLGGIMTAMLRAEAPAGVEIQTNSAGEETLSQGIVLDDTGLLVTVAPSVEPKATFTFTTPDGPAPATVALFDPTSRLLLLKPSRPATEEGKPLPALRATSPAPATRLHWAEETHGDRPAAYAGRISQIKGQPLPFAHFAIQFETDEEPLPGTPIATDEGEIAALVLGPAPDAAPSWLALPAAAVAKVLADFKALGKVDSSQLELGIAIGTSLPRVEFVRAGSRAEKAGLVAGDIILEIGARPIHDVLDILDASFYHNARDPFDLRVLRDLRTLRFTAQPVVKAPE